jgi:hypothetical protein
VRKAVAAAFSFQSIRKKYPVGVGGGGLLILNHGRVCMCLVLQCSVTQLTAHPLCQVCCGD